MIRLHSYTVTKRLNKPEDPQYAGFTIVACWGPVPCGHDEARYSIEHLDDWQGVITWTTAHPVGEELIQV